MFYPHQTRSNKHLPGLLIESLEERRLLSFSAGDPFLKASGTVIRDTHGTGNIVRLRGTNLGNWLYQEPWMGATDSSGTITSNIDSENQLWNLLTSRFGAAGADSLISGYEANYITTADLDNIKALGMNLVRVPFSWRTIENSDGTVRADAFTQMDWLVSNAAQRGIYTIFDLHDLPGPGESTAFWTNTAAQTQVANLWQIIAQHFKGNAEVAGFDIMNEPQEAPSTQAVWGVYNQIYSAIRSADPDHLIMMEGTFINWNWDMLPNPASEGWSNVVYEMHEYQYNSSDATVQAGIDNQVSMFSSHSPWSVPGYIGEFNDFNYNDAWSYSTLQYARAGLSWSEWSYKSAAGDSYGGDIYNSWGIYNDSAHLTAPALSTDSSALIQQKWAAFNSTTGAFVIDPWLSSPLSLGSLDPQVATAASTTTGSNPGTAALSVLGSDSVFGESGLTYTWSVASTVPASLAAPSFTVNSTNAAKNTVVTFSATGSYRFQVAVSDKNGDTAISSVNYVVTSPTWLGTCSIASWNPSLQVLTVTGATIIVADPGSVNPVLQANGSAAVVTISPSASLSVHLGGLSLTNGAAAVVSSVGASRTASNHRVLIVGTASGSAPSLFAVDSVSRLDLVDNDLIVRQGTLSSVTGLLTTGYHGPTVWTGYGIDSSKAAVVTLTSLGIKQSTASQSFDSQSILSGDILVKYTDYGDANLSGSVNSADYAQLDYGFLAHQSGWANGDFNYDNAVNGSDYTLADNAFNMQSGTPLSQAAQPGYNQFPISNNVPLVSGTPVAITPDTIDRDRAKAPSMWITSGFDQ